MIADAIYDEVRRALWFGIATGNNCHLKLLHRAMEKRSDVGAYPDGICR